jgi:hypothetical protein
MNEYPIPHGEHCEPCTLKGDTWSHKSATGLINRMLSRVFPHIRGTQTSSSKTARVHESMADGKNPPKGSVHESMADGKNPPKMSMKSPSLHLSREPPVSGLHGTALAVVFPFSNRSYFVYWPCLMSHSAAP